MSLPRAGTGPVPPKLAISLNASNNESGRALMPMTGKWDIEQRIASAPAFPLAIGEAAQIPDRAVGGNVLLVDVRLPNRD